MLVKGTYLRVLFVLELFNLMKGNVIEGVNIPLYCTFAFNLKKENNSFSIHCLKSKWCVISEVQLIFIFGTLRVKLFALSSFCNNFLLRFC